MSRKKSFSNLVDLAYKYEGDSENEYDIDLEIQIDGKKYKVNSARILPMSLVLEGENITAYYDINRIGFYPTASLFDWNDNN